MYHLIEWHSVRTDNENEICHPGAAVDTGLLSQQLRRLVSSFLFRERNPYADPRKGERP